MKICIRFRTINTCIKWTFNTPRKKDVNRDSHIASSPISQSSFFKGESGLRRGFLNDFHDFFFIIKK